jgi:Gluconate 2-dehydrogenase subunit 3
VRRRPTGTTPGSAEQRFPGFDVLRESRAWDPVTTGVVLGRLRAPPPQRFFTPDNAPIARALIDRLLAQDDEPRVPVLEMVDERLAERRGDGYRYATMPEDWDAWARSLEGLDHDARRTTGEGFADLDRDAQMDLIEQVRVCEGDWHGMPAGRTFELWMRYVCAAFYSHPWAWNEIGFGGPAYPRGYKNLGLGRREDWEVAERDASDPVPWADRVDGARADHVHSEHEPAHPPRAGGDGGATPADRGRSGSDGADSNGRAPDSGQSDDCGEADQPGRHEMRP